MDKIDSFEYFSDDDEKKFLRDGYIISKCENINLLNDFRDQIANWFCVEAKLTKQNNTEKFLNNIHNYISPSEINNLRMFIYSTLNSQSWSRPTFFSFAKNMIEKIVGSELVMQNKINASIMMPKDNTSNISLHSDAHSGESPFQVVLWIALTDIYDSKSMYILSPEVNKYANKHFKSWILKGGKDKVLEELKNELIWLKIPYGSFVLFSSNLFHGSIVNSTQETRWSFNTRFKSLFSPYGSNEKGLGAFYSPIITKPITKLGIKYEIPEGV